ncbi:MAG: hypothetical protein KTR28_09205 [Micavibrio sp.]|nr:hypothetical protein [Micavibrio sp.]
MRLFLIVITVLPFISSVSYACDEHMDAMAALEDKLNSVKAGEKSIVVEARPVSQPQARAPQPTR